MKLFDTRRQLATRNSSIFPLFCYLQIYFFAIPTCFFASVSRSLLTSITMRTISTRIRENGISTFLFLISINEVVTAGIFIEERFLIWEQLIFRDKMPLRSTTRCYYLYFQRFKLIDELKRLGDIIGLLHFLQSIILFQLLYSVSYCGNFST